MKLTIEINGYQQGDLELALREIESKISNGYKSGMDSNETGDYLFRVSGEEVEEWVIAAGYKVGEQLVDDGLTYSERYFNLDEAKSELSEGSNGYKVYGINSDEIIVVEV